MVLLQNFKIMLHKFVKLGNLNKKHYITRYKSPAEIYFNRINMPYYMYYNKDLTVSDGFNGGYIVPHTGTYMGTDMRTDMGSGKDTDKGIDVKTCANPTNIPQYSTIQFQDIHELPDAELVDYIPIMVVDKKKSTTVTTTSGKGSKDQKEQDIKTLNEKFHTYLSKAVSDTSKALTYNLNERPNDINKTKKNKLQYLSIANLYRLETIIKYVQNKFGKSHANEYKLMRQVLKQNPHLFVMAVEYEFDDGCTSKQQHGDLILCDGHTVYVTECKCIGQNRLYSDERDAKVRDQALKCHKRFLSWIRHISQFDKSKSIILTLNIVPAIITDQTNGLLVL